MSTETAVAKSLASAGKRLESMSLLCEMLAGQLERQGREFEEINSAIASGRKQEERGHATPGDIGPEMLA
jgi:hypothetical protein